MLSQDILRQLIDDRRLARERDARKERFAAQARARQRRGDAADESAGGAGVLQLIAARRHATS